MGSILGSPGGSKNHQKIEEIVFGACLERTCGFIVFLVATFERFFEILSRFFEDLGRILMFFQRNFPDFHEFLEGFVGRRSMIRATKETSIDR